MKIAMYLKMLNFQFENQLGILLWESLQKMKKEMLLEVSLDFLLVTPLKILWRLQ